MTPRDPSARATVENAMRDAAALAFEELAFVPVDPQPSELQNQAECAHSSSVRFSGPLSGRLQVSLCGRELVRLIAENMLGDQEADEGKQRDAVGEVANVICGRLLGVLGGQELMFRLGAPEPQPITPERPYVRRSLRLTPPLVDPSDAEHDQEELVASLSVGLEDGRADLELYLFPAMQPA